MMVSTVTAGLLWYTLHRADEDAALPEGCTEAMDMTCLPFMLNWWSGILNVTDLL